jgi:peroxiredoxin
MKTPGRLPLVAFALLGLVRPGLATDEALAPRYRLEVGQQLEYRASSNYKHKSGSIGHKDDRTAWVVRRNDDGVWRVVVRTTSTESHDSKTWSPPDVSLAYFDLAPDGTIVPNDSLDVRFDPTLLFPKLPKDAEQVAKGWEDIRSAVNAEGTSHFKVVTPGTGGRDWVFDEVRETPLDKMYGESYKYRFTFDTQQGFLSRIEDDFTQSYGNAGKSTGKTELVAVQRRDADWIAKLAAESDRYFAAEATFLVLVQRAEKEPIDEKTMEADVAARALARTTHTPFIFSDLSGSPLLAEAKEVITRVRDASTLSVIRDLIDAQLKQHSRTVSASRKSAIRRARVLGKPAPEWDLKDLEGNPRSLKDYRGKVVVLDFWYRGCGWCIRAMPQVNQLADDFKDQPVAILGMNIDSEERDARFVVEAMNLKYPVLKVEEGLQKEYGVNFYPTLVLIGPDGTVRDLHAGYSPTLREDVGRAIRELLPSK